MEKTRAQAVQEQIQAGREMDVVPAEKVFGSGSGHPKLPVKPGLLHTLLALHRLDLPLTTAIARGLVLRMYLGPSAQISPGFRCFYGNLHWQGPVGLNDTFFVDYADIHIGKNTGFSFQNLVITSTHEPGNMGVVRAREIIIGENVWITSRVIILPGVRIGNGAIVGAGSVVSRDIPPRTFAAGIPARPIRDITPADRAACAGPPAT